MNTVNLNLARKWRSRNFDQIVGQDLSVRMLKNSLYLNQFFPVYLFAGQRGSGKTSMARIFASAINCSSLNDFQKNPKTTPLPCLTCTSCTAMLQGNHADFFEIDAASHTGVDTIRQIIDASFMLPVMGSKKIYLIDEAHMLSKASFNALLKVLEEPPTSVVFMLATTDSHKIIDTVRSRCFQLFFKPIASDALINHLVAVCQAENIVFESEALSLIVRESEGSARDAINILEQVRFSNPTVTKESVLAVFGHMSDEQLVELFKAIFSQSPAQLLKTLAKLNVENYATEFVWEQLIALTRAAIWLKHGVAVEQFKEQESILKKLLPMWSWAQLNHLLDQLYTQEPLLLKTTSKYALLEMILLQISQKNRGNNENSNSASTSPQAAVEAADDIVIDGEDEDGADQEDDEEHEDDQEIEDTDAQRWQQFITTIESVNDPLLVSIFKQGQFKQFSPDTGIVDVEFSREFPFFTDWLNDTQKIWQPLLKQFFAHNAIFNPQFLGLKTVENHSTGAQEIVHESHPTPTPIIVPVNRATTMVRSQPIRNRQDNAFDISDTAQWPLANLLIKHFSGTLHELKG